MLPAAVPPPRNAPFSSGGHSTEVCASRIVVRSAAGSTPLLDGASCTGSVARPSGNQAVKIVSSMHCAVPSSSGAGGRAPARRVFAEVRLLLWIVGSSNPEHGGRSFDVSPSRA